MKNEKELEILVDRFIELYRKKPGFTEDGMDSMAIAIESEQAEDAFGDYCTAYEIAIDMIDKYNSDEELLNAFVHKIVP